MLDNLRRTYCGHIGYEFMHITDPEQKDWLQRRIEGDLVSFTAEGKKAILNKLIEAEGFEKFLHVKFVGTKRFGLDGGETTIPAMEQIIKRGGQLGVSEIVFGMPHRGRLNVLVNVMGKPYRQLFHEFQGGSASRRRARLGRRQIPSGRILGPGDSTATSASVAHPQSVASGIVDPVVLGKARAKQQQQGRRPAPRCCRC